MVYQHKNKLILVKILLVAGLHNIVKYCIEKRFLKMSAGEILCKPHILGDQGADTWGKGKLKQVRKI